MDKLYNSNIYLTIAMTNYLCSGRNINVTMTEYENDTYDKDYNGTQTTIYRCYVNRDLRKLGPNDIYYSIVMSYPEFKYHSNPSHTENGRTVIDREV